MLTKPMMFPRASDRTAWQAIAAAARNEITAAGLALQNDGGYPMVTAMQYMAFVRNGSREAMQQPYYARRNRLLRAALAACLSPEEDILGKVTDGLWCICEETTWCLSAHNQSGFPLPDVTVPVLDLFAAQTASLVSWVCYLLEDNLLPILMRRVQIEVEKRVIGPFLHRDDFHWMGVTQQNLNNWTPWILANTLGTAHIWGVDVDARAAVMLQRWLDCVPEDGGIDEGAAYWNMAGGSLLDCLEHLGVDRYHEPKIRNLAAFPLYAHIADGYFINFADCDAKPLLDPERLYTFGVRTDQPAVAALGIARAAVDSSIFPCDTPEFYRTLCKLFHPVPKRTGEAMRGDYTLPDLQVWIRRRGDFFLAAKGGTNGESHNHNDVGSLIVFVDGKPAIIDIGNMMYTASTFRDETRYTLFNTPSHNHNVPMVGSWEQAVGAEFRARDVQMCADSFALDMAGAYPKEAGIRSLRRAFQITAEGITLSDSVVLDAAQEVTWVFMLREKPTQTARGRVCAGPVEILHDDNLRVSWTAHEVTDARLANNFPGVLYRLAFTAKADAAHTRTFHINKAI